MNMYVRLAEYKDSEALSLLNNMFNEVNITSEEIKQNLINNNELIVVGVIDEKIVSFGCAQIYKSFCYNYLHGEITEMYVNEESRGRGSASMMIELLEKELKNQGVKSIKLLTGKYNHIAQKTYLSCGYISKDEAMFYKKINT
ncbi:hypothetical protein CSC2_01350 [Clostridium zeae]|uniref:N-acetyltransferase domain-containing protein n=1 Tax=Clostridium zeae TaxID=2759022 RepID=A0ABQ1E4D8_9CLOT|nr:GNAT family N-acetyltransferase [Clostridium zeae]GFZ29609.1 hypothetical protein CSC2_01350 [Clostridium zeae]